MANPTPNIFLLPLLLLLVMIYTIIANCDSISAAPSPLNYDPPIPATPSYSYPPTNRLAPEPYPSEPISHYPSKVVKAAYWASFDGFEASYIDTTYFTHIYYAFLLLEPTTFKLNVTPFDQQKIPQFIDALRAKKPPVKTLLSIGGAGDATAAVFAKMACTKQTRAVFINSTIDVARNYRFDGVDIDWEFPLNDQEMSCLGSLYRQLQKALVHEARVTGKPRLLLTSAVYYSSKLALNGEVRSYPSDAINKYVDWINAMCYDYHGSWENFTGPNSALYDPTSNISTNYGTRSWIQVGVSPRKLVMGIPLYGRTWTLQDPNVNRIGAPAVDVGPGNGILTYNEVVEFNSERNARVNFDGEVVSYYSYAGDAWVGYDDVMSVDLKIKFAKSWGFGGYFFWALGQDKDWTISRTASTAWGS